MDRVLVYIGLLCIGFLLYVYESSKAIRKYHSLKEDYERLKNEVKLLQQENFYLKQLSKIDTDSEK